MAADDVMGPHALPAPLRPDLLARLARDGDAYARYAWSETAPRGEDGKPTPEARRARREAAKTLLAAQLALLDAERPWGPPARRATRRTLLGRAARTGHPEALHRRAHAEPDDRRRDAGLRRAARAGSAPAALDLARRHRRRGADLATVRRWLRRALVVGMRDVEAEAADALAARARPHLRRFAADPTAWRRRAAQGEPDALLTVGFARWFGREGPASVARAPAAFEAAARAGVTDAALALGLLAFEPEAGLDPDAAAAFAARAAAAGEPTAAWLAAAVSPLDTPAARRRAVAWLRRAAAAGDARAADGLASAYAHGDVVRKDLRAAARWARRAAEAGHEGAMARLARLLDARRTGRRGARREAARWSRRAAHVGNFDDRTNFGVRLHEGDGVRRDDRAAVRWYRLAAAHGCPAATANLGRCYRRGHGVPRSPRAAARWFRRAAEVFENAAGARCLAEMYHRGELGPGGAARALPWTRRAAAMGDPEALGELGIAYHEGHGVAKDLDFAARLYRAGADAGDAWSAYFLGQCHRDGEGVPRDRRLAARWFRVAIAGGVAEARGALRALRRARPSRRA